jgi:hypothetical protein
MSVVWDPIESNGVPPDHWQFLYHLEVFHQRSLTADLVTHQHHNIHADNNNSAHEETSSSGSPVNANSKQLLPGRRASKTTIAPTPHTTNEQLFGVITEPDHFQSPVSGGRAFDGIASLSSEHTTTSQGSPTLLLPTVFNSSNDSIPPVHPQSTPKTSRRPSGASALVGIFRKQVKEDISPPVSPHDSSPHALSSPSPSQKKRKSWLGRIAPNNNST